MAEEEPPFEVEELPDDSYSLDTLPERWRAEASAGRIDAKQWAAANFYDLRFASLSDPSDLEAALLVLKAGVVLLASRADRGSIPFRREGDQLEPVEQHRERLPLGSIQERLRACYLLASGRSGATLDSLFLPYDSGSVFDELISARVAFHAQELEQYAGSAEASWLSILALTGAFGAAELSADFIQTPEIAHAAFLQINATSPSLQVALERCVSYMSSRMREKRPSELSIGQASQLILVHMISVLRRGSAGSLALDVEDVFAFWGLISALHDYDVVRAFAELAALLSGGLGHRFDERGAPLRAGHRPRKPSSTKAHPAAPIVASMVREWTAHGDLPYKLLSGKHLPPDASPSDMHARLIFSPEPRSSYLRARLIRMDEDEVLDRAANALREPFRSSVIGGRVDEDAARLRLVDSADEVGAAGPAIVFLLQDEGRARERAAALSARMAPPPSPAPPAPSSPEAAPLGVRSPFGSDHFLGPEQTILARAVPRDRADFTFGHLKGGKDEPVNCVIIKPRLLDELAELPVPRDNFAKRSGWTLSRAAGAVEVASSSESGPVLLGGAPVGIVRIVNVVRTDGELAKKPVYVSLQGMSGSRWFAGLDAPKASPLRDLFSPSTRLMRLYKEKSEQMLGNNVVTSFTSAEPDDARFRESAVAAFGTIRGSLTKKRREAGMPVPLTLGTRAGQKEDSLLVYGQLGLGRFFDLDQPAATVLQLVAFLPLGFRIEAGTAELAVFPWAMPEVKSLPPDWTAGQSRPDGSSVAVQVLENGAEVFFRMARLYSGRRTDQIPVAAPDQYERWIRPLPAALPLDQLAIAGGGSIPEAMQFEDRHYVFLPDSKVYVSQQTDKGVLQVSFLYASTVRSLLLGEEIQHAPAPSTGFELDAFLADVAQLLSPSQRDVDMNSGELRSPSLELYPASEVDAYYSNVVASAVLDLSEPEDVDELPVLNQIRERLSVLLASRKAPVFFGDARRSDYNYDSIMELAMPDYIFGERFFSEEYERASPELVRRAFLEPLDALEAAHLRDQPAHLEAVRTIRALLLYDENDLRAELVDTPFDDLAYFCEARGFVSQALDTVRDMWKAAAQPGAPLVSNGLLLRRFFLPSAHREGREPIRSYFGWLSFTEATAAQYRFPKDDTAVFGLCALYAVAEGILRQRRAPPSI